MAAELNELLASDYDVVATVGDGEALVEAAQRIRPDAIVSDIAMPGVNGLDAAASILAARPESCIVFVTVQDSRSLIRRALKSGARGYVLKTDAGHELVAAVRAALEGQFYVSSNSRITLANTQRPGAPV